MISVIIPTYNERENILPLLENLISTLSRTNELFEILIVDDNSPDGTANAVKKKYKSSLNIQIFVRHNERGLSTAILHGIKKSKGDIVIGMDADFNHPPELISRLIKELDTSHLVVASRFIERGGMDKKARYIGTYLFNYVLKNILGFPTMDNMSGYYAIRQKDLLRLKPEEIYRGYGEYHLRLLWFAMRSKMKIIEIPVYYKKRKYGKSKSNLPRMFISYMACALKLRLKDNRSVVV